MNWTCTILIFQTLLAGSAFPPGFRPKAFPPCFQLPPRLQQAKPKAGPGVCQSIATPCSAGTPLLLVARHTTLSPTLHSPEHAMAVPCHAGGVHELRL